MRLNGWHMTWSGGCPPVAEHIDRAETAGNGLPFQGQAHRSDMDAVSGTKDDQLVHVAYPRNQNTPINASARRDRQHRSRNRRTRAARSGNPARSRRHRRYRARQGRRADKSTSPPAAGRNGRCSPDHGSSRSRRAAVRNGRRPHATSAASVSDGSLVEFLDIIRARMRSATSFLMACAACVRRSASR